MGRLLDLFFNKYPYTDFHELNADWLITATKEMLETVDKIDDWKTQHEAEYQELKQLYDDLLAGNYPESFIDSLQSWIEEYGIEIIANKIKFVQFGLTNDGYFCAFIPDNWSDIQFDTITDFDDPLYGHLMLIYD